MVGFRRAVNVRWITDPLMIATEHERELPDPERPDAVELTRGRMTAAAIAQRARTGLAMAGLSSCGQAPERLDAARPALARWRARSFRTGAVGLARDYGPSRGLGITTPAEAGVRAATCKAPPRSPAHRAPPGPAGD